MANRSAKTALEMKDLEVRLDPDAYDSFSRQCCSVNWPETNCYTDVYISMLNGLGLDAYGCMAFTLASDFEGDHFTFFKPPLSDLRTLYGLNVQELTLWRPLIDHVEEHVNAGRIVCPEVDSFYLPDTRATDYRRAHVKTTIGITSIDRNTRTLSYFHNAGHFRLHEDDYDGIFRIGRDGPADYLPPYCELLDLDRLTIRPTAQLVELSRELARQYLSYRPERNPMRALGIRLSDDLVWLAEGDLEKYHLYVFATLRQCGANFDLTAQFLRWLENGGVPGLSEPAEHFAALSNTAKTCVLKLARIVNTRKLRDLSANIIELEEHWARGMDKLASALTP